MHFIYYSLSIVLVFKIESKINYVLKTFKTPIKVKTEACNFFYFESNKEKREVKS